MSCALFRRRLAACIGAIIVCTLSVACSNFGLAASDSSPPVTSPLTTMQDTVTISSPPVDVCQNIDDMQTSPPEGTVPGLSDDGVHDDCRSPEDWQSIYDAKAKAAVDEQFQQLDGELNGLVEQMQGAVAPDRKWDASIYLNAAVKFACTNQDRPGAGEKASFMYNANWQNWTPAEGDHLYMADFSDELAQYGCAITPVSEIIGHSG